MCYESRNLFITLRNSANEVRIIWIMVKHLHFHVCLCLPISFFPSDFSMKTSHSRLSPMCCIPCPSVIDLIIPIFGEYKLCGYLMQVPSACCCFIPIGSDILSILFSNTFSLCCFLHVRDQLSHSYRTTIFYILIFTLLDGM